MSISAIRKTRLPYKGGPGAVGVRFDPDDERLKIHDGDEEINVVTGNALEAIEDPTGGSTEDAEARTAIASIIDALEAFGILTPAPTE